jgi:hypothetical protein
VQQELLETEQKKKGKEGKTRKKDTRRRKRIKPGEKTEDDTNKTGQNR